MQQDKQTAVNVKTKNQNKKIALIAVVTLVFLFVCAGVGITYAFFVDKVNIKKGVDFGQLAVDIDYSDSSKMHSSFALSSVSTITPGQEIGLEATISSTVKNTNDLIDSATKDSYLRLKLEIEGFEDEALTKPVDAMSQEKLDIVAQNIIVKAGVTTWVKSADCYIYYAGNASSDKKLCWTAGSTETLSGNLLITFPESEMTAVWADRFCKFILTAETIQYETMEIDYSSCADAYDMANCVSSKMLDYNVLTGLPIGECALRTSYCSTATETFTKNTNFSVSDFVGDVNSLRVYQAGTRISPSSNTYSVTSGSPSRIEFKSNITQYSLFLACAQYSIDLLDSEDSSLYQKIYSMQNGKLPTRVEVPKKDNYSFVGFYTGRNGAGIQIYDAMGISNVETTAASQLYAYFIIADATLSYRDTIIAFGGDNAFNDAFSASQLLNTYEATITIYRDFSISSKHTITTTNLYLTIKSVKKANNEYCSLNFTGSMNNCFELTSDKQGNTLCFTCINLNAPNNANMRCIVATNNNVAIHDNVNITNFGMLSSEGGSVIRCQNGDVDIRGENSVAPDVVVTNCTSTGAGGVIRLDSATLNIINAKFAGCKAGVGSANGGGVIASWRSEVVIENSTFTNNTSTENGGCFSFLSNTNATINSGVFDSNEATQNGGVLFASGGSKIYIKGGEFTSNVAKTNAGGVVCVDENNTSCYISGGIFGDNTKTISATASDYSNSATKGGGAICAKGASILEIFSTRASCPIIAYNYGGTDTNYDGGGILVAANALLRIYKESGATQVPTIKYNYANRGGAICAYNNLTTGTVTVPTTLSISVSDCYIYGNKAEFGGAYSCNSSGANNQVVLQIYNGAIIENNEAANNGGAIMLNNGVKNSVYMYGGQIINNRTTVDKAGAIFVGSNAYLSISGGEVSSNYSKTLAGGIYVANNSATCVITGGKFRNNTAITQGGAIYYDSGAIGSIENATLDGNIADTQGGGLWLNSSINVTECNIKNNTATVDGGGIYCSSAFNGRIDSCTIDSNEAGNAGGGVYSIGINTMFTNSTIKSNTATKQGGGIFVNALNFGFSGNLIISGNTSGTIGGGMYLSSTRTVNFNINCGLVVSENQSLSHGGGIYFQLAKCSIILTRCVMYNNQSINGSGGAICNGWNSGELIINGDNVRIYGNIAQNAGAIYLESGDNGTSGTIDDDYSSNLTMNAGYIYSNSASKLGGAIYGESPNNTTNAISVVNINGGEIFGNSCASSNITNSSPFNRGGGGAICMAGYSKLNITGGKIYGNSTTATGLSKDDYGGGGAICMANNSTLTIAGGQIGGDTFSNANKAPNGFGGAIMLGNATTCTISGGVIGSAVATTSASVNACANSAKSAGGIWVGKQAKLTIEVERNTNPYISWNYNTSNNKDFDGGAIRSFGETKINQAKTGYDSNTICYFNYNTAAGGRGAIYSTEGVLKVKNCAFTGSGGNAIRWDIGDVKIEYVRCIDSSAEQLYAVGQSVIDNCYCSGSTYGISVLRPNISVINCEILGATTSGIIIGETASNPVISNCNIHNCAKRAIIFSTTAECNSSITNCDIHSNGDETIEGAGVFVHILTKVKIVNCNISDNFATFGSALYNEGGYVEVQGCTIEGNKQTRSGAITAIKKTESGTNYYAQTYITGVRGNEILNSSELTTSKGWATSYSSGFTGTSYDSSKKETTIKCTTSPTNNEHWYKSISLTAGKTYLFSVDYELVKALKQGDWAQTGTQAQYGLKMQLLTAVPTQDIDGIALEASSSSTESVTASTGINVGTKSRMFIEYTCTRSATYYINFNFGVLEDTASYEVKLKNLIVSEYERGSATIITNNTRVSASVSSGYGGAGVTNLAQCVMALHNATISYNTNNISNSAAGLISDFGIQISACNIFSNVSDANGAGIKLGAGNTDTIIYANTNIYSNMAVNGEGGAIYTDNNTSPLALIGVNLYNNKAHSWGGAIRAGSALHLIACQIYGNETESNGGGGVAGSSNATITIHSGAVIGGTNAQTANVCVTYGGGIYTDGNITMYGGCIGNPNATEHASQTSYANYAQCGGGISSQATFVMNGGMIGYNWASQDCGGFRGSRASTFAGGNICYNGSVDGAGAVVYGSNAEATIKGTDIHHNFATNGGGGFVVWNTIKKVATLQSGKIYLNEASMSAGIWLKSSGAQMQMSGGEIYSNKSHGNGGGIGINNGATFTMSGGSIRSNNATQCGGGVSVYGTFTMSNGSIMANIAGSNGGGVWKTNDSTFNHTGGDIAGNLPEESYSE